MPDRAENFSLCRSRHRQGELKDTRYHLLPIYANLIKPDNEMQALIDRRHAPYTAKFGKNWQPPMSFCIGAAISADRWIR